VYMSKLKGVSKENGYDGLHQVHISHAAHTRTPASILSELVFSRIGSFSLLLQTAHLPTIVGWLSVSLLNTDSNANREQSG
jgi:hypothetical protein